jgi:hypothetical protein
MRGHAWGDIWGDMRGHTWGDMRGHTWGDIWGGSAWLRGRKIGNRRSMGHSRGTTWGTSVLRLLELTSRRGQDFLSDGRRKWNDTKCQHNTGEFHFVFWCDDFDLIWDYFGFMRREVCKVKTWWMHYFASNSSWVGTVLECIILRVSTPLCYVRYIVYEIAKKYKNLVDIKQYRKIDKQSLTWRYLF